MNVHIFKGAGSQYGFDKDAAGSNLPSGQGPWKHQKAITIQPNENRIGVNSDDIIDGISKDGYYITSAKIVISGP